MKKQNNVRLFPEKNVSKYYKSKDNQLFLMHMKR